MKKIVGIIAALALAGAVFADAPSVTPVVASFDGSAALEWIANLDDETTGMKNDNSASFKIKFVTEGTKETSGDGLWGELQIKAPSWEVGFGETRVNYYLAKIKKTDDSEVIIAFDGNVAPASPAGDDGWFYANGDAVKASDIKEVKEWPLKEGIISTPGGASVEVAKIHFIDGDFYLHMDIKCPDFKLGGADIPLATKGNLGYDQPEATNFDGRAGFTLNTGLENVVDVKIKFADNGEKKGGDKEFAFGAEATLKAVENLSLYGGFGYDTISEKVEFAANANYKIGIDDTFYVKPAVGFAYYKTEAKQLAAGVLFGWGTEGQEPGFKGFSNGVNNVENKCADGVSFGIKTDLEDGTGINLFIGAYDSTMIAGLADALAGLKVGVQFLANTETISDAWSLDAAAAYSNTFGIFKFGANFGLGVRKILDNTETGILWGASVETDEIIQNTTLYVKYTDGEKAEKIGGADKKGKVTVGAKIHF